MPNKSLMRSQKKSAPDANQHNLSWRLIIAQQAIMDFLFKYTKWTWREVFVLTAAVCVGISLLNIGYCWFQFSCSRPTTLLSEQISFLSKQIVSFSLLSETFSNISLLHTSDMSSPICSFTHEEKCIFLADFMRVQHLVSVNWAQCLVQNMLALSETKK